MLRQALAVLVLLTVGPLVGAESVKYQVLGLFMPGRDRDLRDVVGGIPEIRLVSVDYANAEATFDFDAAKVFPGAKPGEVLQRLDDRIRHASRGSFSVKPVRTMPLAKLQFVEIKVVGLDCKACSLAAYEAIYKLDGVERATASFREGRVTAHIDPKRIDRAALEAALRKRGVDVPAP